MKRIWNVSWMYEVEVEAETKMEAQVLAYKAAVEADHGEEFFEMLQGEVLQTVEVEE